MKFRPKGEEIEARQVLFADENAIAEILAWCGGERIIEDGKPAIEFRRETGRIQIAEEGDWISKDAWGACDTIDAEALTENYEPIP